MSIAEPIISVSETKVCRFFAMAMASSIVEAYCNISRAKIEIGIFAPVGKSDLDALIVTLNPFSFSPEATPVKPAHE